jgi:Protein of unknown function (DUF4230)
LRERLRKSGKLLFEFTDALREFVFQIFADCSGGNSSPSYPADAGGCIFCTALQPAPFFLDAEVFFLSYDAYFVGAMDRKQNLWPIVLLLGLVVLILTAALAFDRATNLPARMLDSFTDRSTAKAKEIRDAFVQLFQLQPRVTVNNHVFFEQTKTALELAVVDRDTEVTQQLSNTWLGSTKTIRIRATYRVKAGFALPENLTVNVSDQNISVKVPPAKILSVEPLSVQVEQLQNGLWNQIQAKDIEDELKTMPEIARSKESTLPAEAQQKFRDLLTAKLSNLPVKIELEQQNAERR